MEPSCSLGTTRKKNFPESDIINPFIFTDQVCSVKMAGYWPRSFFLRVYRLGPCINMQKENLANIQSS